MKTDFLKFDICIGLDTSFKFTKEKQIAYHPAAQSRRHLRNDERTILLPVLETELRDFYNI